MYVENLWLLSVALFTLGAIAGYAIFKLQIWLEPNKYSTLNKRASVTGKDSQETTDFKLVLQKQEAEFQKYYQTVITHYVKTMKLLEDLDGDYKLFSQHLKSNVFKVVDKNDFYKAVKESKAKADDLDLPADQITSKSMTLKKDSVGSVLKHRLKSALHFLPTKSQELLSQTNRNTKAASNQKSYEVLDDDEINSNNLIPNPEMIPSSPSQDSIDDNYKSIQEVLQDEDFLESPEKGTKTTTVSEHKNPVKHEASYNQDHNIHSSSTSKEDASMDSPFNEEDG